MRLPSRGRGRPSAAATARYEAELDDFCTALREISGEVGFSISARGWCYLLEQRGVITKGEFDRAQRVINECREDGRLPIEICAEDDKRAWRNVEDIGKRDPYAQARDLLRLVRYAIDDTNPFSFWEGKRHYVQMLVEKADLVSLFEPECLPYRVAIANAGGNADFNSRAQMMRRYAAHEAAGRRCVLLYAGDFDPKGLDISGGLRRTINRLADAVGWRADRLHIERFALNLDFIEANNLTWIDNLETGSGRNLDDPRHPDHGMPYVQTYLRRYGARKCEANALVTRRDEGRRLCRDAILQWVDEDAPEEYEAEIAPYRAELLGAVRELAEEAL